MQKWKGVKTLVKIVREVYKKADKSTRIETVYYITNLIDPKKINRAIRAHWGIENNLHRSLDVLLNEDHSQKSNHNVVENFHIMSLLALFIIKEISKQRGISMNRTRKLCGYSSPSKLLVN
ncbi:ISAs1 family transposase [Capnocytophaga gingivalis]